MAASSPPEVCGSWASVTSSGATPSAIGQRGQHEPPVVRGTAGLDAGRGQVERAVERREGGGIEDEAGAGRARHLEPMAEEAEAGHVGGGGHPVCDEHLGRGAVERAHLVDRGSEMVGRGTALTGARHEHACAEPLGEEQDVAGSRPALAQELVGVGGADHGEAVLGLRVADRVAAGQRPAGLADLGRGAVEDLGQHVTRQVLGERRDRQREQHPAAHREHVGERVRGCDLAVGPRVVDERREEVERADDREVVADSVGGGIVRRGQAGDQLVRGVGRGVGAKSAERVSEQVRPELRGTAAAVGEVGQAQRVRRRGLERRHVRMIGPAALPSARERSGPGGSPGLQNQWRGARRGAVGSTPTRSRHDGPLLDRASPGARPHPRNRTS